MRICIGLETHDYMEAQRRALLLLRYNKRLEFMTGKSRKNRKLHILKKRMTYPCFGTTMKFKAKMVTPVDIFRRKKIDARPMSTRERAMLPAAERVNSIFLRRTLKKRSSCNASPTCLTTSWPGKRQEIILPDGTSTTVGVMQGKADFIAKARAFMDAEGMAANAGDNRITNIGARSRLSLIFDTYTRSCYGQARWESGMTPEMLYSYPAWRFVRHPGARMPRPIHVLHEGAVRLKTDFQFWAVEMNSPAIGGLPAALAALRLQLLDGH